MEQWQEERNKRLVIALSLIFYKKKWIENSDSGGKALVWSEDVCHGWRGLFTLPTKLFFNSFIPEKKEHPSKKWWLNRVSLGWLDDSTFICSSREGPKATFGVSFFLNGGFKPNQLSYCYYFKRSLNNLNHNHSYRNSPY